MPGNKSLDRKDANLVHPEQANQPGGPSESLRADDGYREGCPGVTCSAPRAGMANARHPPVGPPSRESRESRNDEPLLHDRNLRDQVRR
jgi:hypothetical protein